MRDSKAQMKSLTIKQLLAKLTSMSNLELGLNAAGIFFTHQACSRNQSQFAARRKHQKSQMPLSAAIFTKTPRVLHSALAKFTWKPQACCAQCFNLSCFSFQFGDCVFQRCTNTIAVIAAHLLEKRLQHIVSSRSGQSRSHGYYSRSSPIELQ